MNRGFGLPSDPNRHSSAHRCCKSVNHWRISEMKRSIFLAATVVVASILASQASAASVGYIPYVNGVGDPSGLTSPQSFDSIETGSIVESFGAYLPYVNGIGDPSGLTSPQQVDLNETGSTVESFGDYLPYV